MATKKTKDVLSEKLAAAQTALLTGRARDYSQAKAALEKEIDEYNTLTRRAKYKEMQATDNPFEAFARTVFYTGKRTKENKDSKTGVVDSITVEDMSRRLNLKEFVECIKADKEILSEIGNLQTLLLVRKREVLKLSDADYAKESFLYCRIVKEKESGKTPDSNTQICKKLQGILDMAGLEYRVTNKDFGFIMQCCFLHDSKAVGRVKPCTAGKFMSLIVDVMAHYVQGIDYSVLEKEQKKSA